MVNDSLCHLIWHSSHQGHSISSAVEYQHNDSSSPIFIPKINDFPHSGFLAMDRYLVSLVYHSHIDLSSQEWMNLGTSDSLRSHESSHEGHKSESISHRHSRCRWVWRYVFDHKKHDRAFLLRSNIWDEIASSSNFPISQDNVTHRAIQIICQTKIS